MESMAAKVMAHYRSPEAKPSEQDTPKLNGTNADSYVAMQHVIR